MRNRTADLLITSELLYQLSYVGPGGKMPAGGPSMRAAITAGGLIIPKEEGRENRRQDFERRRKQAMPFAESGAPLAPPYCCASSR